MTQLDMFDNPLSKHVIKTITLAQAMKHEAMERVEKNADQYWKDCVELTIRQVAKVYQEFTADTVWEHVKATYGDSAGPSTHEPRALGALMKNAAKEGLIESTPIHINSKRPECHSRPIRVWKSLVY